MLQRCVGLLDTHSTTPCAAAPADAFEQEIQVTVRVQFRALWLYCERRTPCLQRPASQKI